MGFVNQALPLCERKRFEIPGGILILKQRHTETHRQFLKIFHIYHLGYSVPIILKVMTKQKEEKKTEIIDEKGLVRALKRALLVWPC